MNTWKKELNPELMRIVSGGELSHDDKKAIFNTIYEAKKRGWTLDYTVSWLRAHQPAMTEEEIRFLIDNWSDCS